ncbi:hypothetical protein GCM10022221_74470 [Actinocorallia aurea]
MIGEDSVPHCMGEVCLTCAEGAIAARVHEVRPGGRALVETGAGPVEVSVALVDARPGDLLLIHADEALAVVEELR